MNLHKFSLHPYNHKQKPHLKWVVTGLKGEGGKPSRRFFRTKGAAKTFLDQMRIETHNLGQKAFELPDEAKLDAAKCLKLLSPYGKTLSNAVDFYLEHLKITQKSCTVEELFGKFIEVKRIDGASKRYIISLRSCIGRFAEDFGDNIISEITSLQVGDWLRSLSVSPVTRNNYRRFLGVFFEYSVEGGYASTNPIRRITPAKENAGPTEIFSPKEIQSLLIHCDTKVLPYLAIGAFAGLRSAEINRLTWENVRLDRSFIEIPAKKAKTAQRRLVEIQPNLHAWLTPFASQKGKICPPNFRKWLTEEIARSGVEWKNNGLRHSFASYFLAKFPDAPRLAMELGHTDTHLIFKNYRELVTPDEAEEYWNIFPETGEKVVQMRP